MLVLSRKQNERIVVGGSVVVTVVRISGDKVRLGIDAPADVRVVRDEVADRDELQAAVAQPIDIASAPAVHCFVA